MSILGTFVTSGCALLGTVIGLASQPIIKKIDNSQLEKKEKSKDLKERTQQYTRSCSAVYQANKELIKNYHLYQVVDSPKYYPEDEDTTLKQLDEGANASLQKIDDAKAEANQNMVILIAETSKLKEPLTKLMKAADFVHTMGIDFDTDITNDLVKEADAMYQKRVVEVGEALRKFI